MKKVFTLLIAVGVVILLSACGSGAKEEIVSEYRREVNYIRALELMNSTSDETYMIYMYRPDCPACQRFAPEISAAIEREQVVMYALNTNNMSVDELQDMKDKTGASATPTTMFFQSGEMKYSMEGAKIEGDVVKVIQEYMK